jgi:hypothetical protein
LYGYAAVVPIPEFKKVFPALEIKEAFCLIVTQVIFNAAVLGNDGDRDVNLWFESGSSNGVILKSFRAVSALDWRPNKRLRRIRFKDKSLRALQAADLVARESYKHIDNFGIRSPRMPVHELSERLVFMCWTLSRLQYHWPKRVAEGDRVSAEAGRGTSPERKASAFLEGFAAKAAAIKALRCLARHRPSEQRTQPASLLPRKTRICRAARTELQTASSPLPKSYRKLKNESHEST